MNFWYENEKGIASLNNYLFKEFLEQNHFFKNKPNENSTFNLIKKEGIFLKIRDEFEVKDFVLDYILKNNLGMKVYNLMTGKASIFKRDYLSMLETQEIKVLRDTKDTAYLFYQNGVVEVNKEGFKLNKYDDYGLSIWEEQVIKRDFILADHHSSEYRKFIWAISGGFLAKTEQQKENSISRYNTFQSVIGYLLHTYNSSGNNRAIILNDEAISDDPNGRSGKGLFWNAIKYLKKTQSLNGKSFDFKSQFPYQSVKSDCQVLVWDDVKKNFDFEQLFSVITEGIEITYKGQNTIKLPIEDSPKILITTNYTIKGKGGSHEARRFEVELSNFFNDSHTPIDFFGHKLFESWDAEEWARFDSYMIECLRKYLTHGLIPYQAINLPLKKFQVDISKELFDAIESIPKNEWVNFNDFYDSYATTVKKFTEKTKTFVSRSLNKYCDFMGLKIDTVVSNGIKKIMLIQKGLDENKEDFPF